MKVTFIGCGNMGEAMLAAILNKKLSTPRSIIISDASESRRLHLKQKYCVPVTADNHQAADKSDVIVLAVKPQNLPEVMSELKGSLRLCQVALSIVAGAKFATLCQGLDHRQVVRSMPNTPACIGEGITAWTATAETTGQQREQARSILGVMGKEIFCENEEYLDMATAVSGSGPAYFFLFAECLIEAAAQIGLPRDTAQELVIQTMLGSACLLRDSDKAPSALRQMVTSPGGTTAAALSQFEKGALNRLVWKAVTAAYNRARELGG
jgi:pyrroline-5-carboxylate reductase